MGINFTPDEKLAIDKTARSKGFKQTGVWLKKLARAAAGIE